MDMSSKVAGALRRITDLFVEGRELVIGQDDDGTDVLIWVNKPNSFEAEEARRDGAAAQAQRKAALMDPESGEVEGIKIDLASWDHDGLAQAVANLFWEEDQFKAMADVESDKDWSERLVMLRRQPDLLDDAKVPEDDARRVELAKIATDYHEHVHALAEARNKERTKEWRDQSRTATVEEYVKQAVNRMSVDTYMAEKRVTETWFALRVCVATRDEATEKWDHSKCDHSQRLLERRADVRGLPQGLLDQVDSTLREIMAGFTEAGNLDAPTSSSASSGQPSEEEASTPSTPKGKRRAARTT